MIECLLSLLFRAVCTFFRHSFPSTFSSDVSRPCPFHLSHRPFPCPCLFIRVSWESGWDSGTRRRRKIAKSSHTDPEGRSGLPSLAGGHEFALHALTVVAHIRPETKDRTVAASLRSHCNLSLAFTTLPALLPFVFPFCVCLSVCLSVCLRVCL